MGIVYRETNPGPIRIIGRNVFLLRETEDSLLEDELRLRGSHTDRYTTLTVIRIIDRIQWGKFIDDADIGLAIQSFMRL